MPAPLAASSGRDLVLEAVNLSTTDPVAAERMARDVLGDRTVVRQPDVRALAHRALGMAAREDHRLGEAVRHLRLSVRIADRYGLDVEAARSRVQLGPTLALRGEGHRGLEEIDRAEGALSGYDLGLLQLQRGNVLLFGGELVRALAAYRAAAALLRGSKDLRAQASLFNNRSILLCGQGTPQALRAAAADLRRAEALFAALADHRAHAMVLQNLGYVAAKRGDLTTALRWFETADGQFRLLGVVDAVGLRDRCEALLPARLLTEARAAVEQAVSLLRDQGEAAYLAEAQLVLARTALLQGEYATARTAAHDAASLFRRQGRRRWSHVARQAEIEAAWLSNEKSDGLLRAARRLAEELERDGWVAQARHTRVIAAQLALELRRPELVRRELAASTRGTGRWPAEFRVEAYHAVALTRLAAGDRRGARRALRAGLRTIDRYRAALGASELRAHAAGLGTDLALTGLRQALADGHPGPVLWWMDRWRAASLHTNPIRPSSDPELTDLLIELRRQSQEVDRALLNGEDARRLARRLVALEDQVCRHTRRAPGSMLSVVPSPPSLSGVRSLLGDRAFVELFDLDERLYAVVVTSRHASVHTIGDTAAAEKAQQWLQFGLRRLARTGALGARREANAARVSQFAAEVDGRVLEPLSAAIEGRDVVLAPPPRLFSTAWGALPSLRGRGVSVVPSAALWVKAVSQLVPTSERVVLVAGPDLPYAPMEITKVLRCYPTATVLIGGSARAARVCPELEHASLGHLATHGRFRSDNPLLSSIQLADGPLTVYDLERLSSTPDRIVLSACSSGETAAVYGSELVGFLACLFSLGTRTVVASVAPVEDESTANVIASFHAHLRAGLGPGHALAAATADGDGPMSAAQLCFVCFGVG